MSYCAALSFEWVSSKAAVSADMPPPRMAIICLGALEVVISVSLSAKCARRRCFNAGTLWKVASAAESGKGISRPGAVLGARGRIEALERSELLFGKRSLERHAQRRSLRARPLEEARGAAREIE